MFRSSLFVLIVSYLFFSGESFQIKLGSAKTVLSIYNLNDNNEIKESRLFIYRALIFPYEVYEIGSLGSTIPEAKSFIFARIAYQALQQTLNEQGRTFNRVNQYTFIYHKIPETVLFEGNPNQYMELIHEDPSLFNSHFIIKNSSQQYNTKTDGIIDLNFYSIQLTKYFQQSIHNAEKDMKSLLKQDTVKSILKSSTNFTQQGIKSNATERNQFIMTYFLINDSNPVYFSQLFMSQMHHKIQKQAIWFSYNDGFSIYFASAVLQRSNKENQTLIDLWIMIMREGKEKRTQHIKEPVGLLNMSSIKYLKLCVTADRLKLLLGDMSNVFVIDVTTHLWSINLFKIGITFNDLILDNTCKLLKINSQNITEINGVTKVKFDQRIKSVATLKNFFVFCLDSNACKIYSKDLSKQVSQVSLNGSFESLKCFQSMLINNSKIIHQLSLLEKGRKVPEIKYFDYVYGNKNSLKENQSSFSSFIYPYGAYLNKTFLREQQLDKTIFYHLSSLENRQQYRILKNFHNFSKQLLLQGCSNFERGETSQKITIKGGFNWTICGVSLTTTSSLIHLKIDPNNTQSKMFICETSYENYNINPQINCQAYLHLDTERSYYIPNNKFVKFYILRTFQQNHLPTFYLRDLQRQQILYASTIFFYLMLILSLSFFLVIIFIIVRPLLIAVMIYYGWRPDLAVPTYPLSWFQLKIKIKRLVQTKFLRYVPHQPTNQGQDNHCCFCLQTLTKGTLIAQLYCFHQFHKECFNEWIKNEPNLRCPTCRREFTRQQLNEYRNSHNLM